MTKKNKETKKTNKLSKDVTKVLKEKGMIEAENDPVFVNNIERFLSLELRGNLDDYLYIYECKAGKFKVTVKIKAYITLLYRHGFRMITHIVNSGDYFKCEPSNPLKPIIHTKANPWERDNDNNKIVAVYAMLYNLNKKNQLGEEQLESFEIMYDKELKVIKEQSHDTEFWDKYEGERCRVVVGRRLKKHMPAFLDSIDILNAIDNQEFSPIKDKRVNIINDKERLDRFKNSTGVGESTDVDVQDGNWKN